MSKLFNDLMSLCDPQNPQGFYFVDQENDAGTPTRTFGYRIVSYSDWLKPGALEARGITFDISDIQNPKILCRPMKKFFNLNENPFTIGLDLSKISQVMTKEDGSLLSFYWDNHVISKTKMTHYSEQAKDALELLMTDKELYQEVERLTKLGYTLNFEFVSPKNRVVIFYDKPKLILLNVRHNETGGYMRYEDLKRNKILSKVLVKSKETKFDIDEVLNSKDIEGYVGILNDGTWFKLKTLWYASLHKTKDNLLAPDKTLIAVANDGYDDLYSLVSTDGEKEYLDKALKVYKDFMSGGYQKIKNLHQSYQGLSRKDYALKGQESLSDERYLFGILMTMFGKDLDDDKLFEDLKTQFIKNVDKFTSFING